MIRAVFEWIQNNTFLDVVFLFVFTYVLEISKVKINPWSWLGKKIGKTINGEVIDKLEETNERIDKLEERQKEEEERALKRDAELCRKRIVRFADELRRKMRHSEEFFNDILDDISDYEHYCAEHPGYKNEKAKASIEKIRNSNRKCMENDSYL